MTVTNHSTPGKARGFSLMELMIALVIIAMLAGVAYPSYQNQMRASRRAEAQNALLDLASRMEKYYYDNGRYDTATIDVAAATDVIGSAATTPGGHYTLSFNPAATATTYTLRATPAGTQASDTICGFLWLDNVGTKSSENDANAADGKDPCWKMY